MCRQARRRASHGPIPHQHARRKAIDLCGVRRPAVRLGHRRWADWLRVCSVQRPSCLPTVLRCPALLGNSKGAWELADEEAPVPPCLQAEGIRPNDRASAGGGCLAIRLCRGLGVGRCDIEKDDRHEDRASHRGLLRREVIAELRRLLAMQDNARSVINENEV
jgi:hypothetical protein